MSVIHMRLRPNNTCVFREWSTISNRYTTLELNEAQMHAYLFAKHPYRHGALGAIKANRDVCARLDRAKTRGSSHIKPDPDIDVEGPWDTERCLVCAKFHHSYSPTYDLGYQPFPGFIYSECRVCGAPERDVVHKPSCEKEKT